MLNQLLELLVKFALFYVVDSNNISYDKHYGKGLGHAYEKTFSSDFTRRIPSFRL
jgi:hypothetical protein